MSTADAALICPTPAEIRHAEEHARKVMSSPPWPRVALGARGIAELDAGDYLQAAADAGLDHEQAGAYLRRAAKRHRDSVARSEADAARHYNSGGSTAPRGRLRGFVKGMRRDNLRLADELDSIADEILGGEVPTYLPLYAAGRRWLPIAGGGPELDGDTELDAVRVTDNTPLLGSYPADELGKSAPIAAGGLNVGDYVRQGRTSWARYQRILSIENPGGVSLWITLATVDGTPAGRIRPRETTRLPALREWQVRSRLGLVAPMAGGSPEADGALTLSPKAELLVLALRAGPLTVSECQEAIDVHPSRFPPIVRELDDRGAGLTVCLVGTGRHSLTEAGLRVAARLTLDRLDRHPEERRYHDRRHQAERRNAIALSRLVRAETPEQAEARHEAAAAFGRQVEEEHEAAERDSWRHEGDPEVVRDHADNDPEPITLAELAAELRAVRRVLSDLGLAGLGSTPAVRLVRGERDRIERELLRAMPPVVTDRS